MFTFHYRDDCLAVIEGSARIVEKKIRELFKKENLGIVVAPAAKITDFLDVELNLNTGKFKPF